jgi:ribosome-associated toxin RatA of RatAB toxin-antitoxin module
MNSPERSESEYPVHGLFPIIFLLLAAYAAPAADLAQESTQHGDLDITVSLNPGEQSGSARAAVRIHARREVVWSLITSCAEELNLFPGLVGCEVLETAPDRSWQRIRHVMNYSWYAPRLTFEVRASYDQPSRVTVERISGDLRILRGSWTLQDDGDDTIAHYAVDLAPGIWVPRWIVRAALRRDLPKMLRALRTRAEFVQKQTPG